MDKKKKNIQEVIMHDRYKSKDNDLDKNQNEGIRKYNKLKEQLMFNLQDEVENRIQRMKILYEIKQEELYKYDGFKSFEQFIKSYVIAKSQAYRYLKIYEKVVEGVVSIDEVKEIGFRGIYKYIQKKESKDLLDVNQDNEDQGDDENIPVRILIKDKELYKFCKQDTKRVYFILQDLYNNKKDVLMDSISKYEEHKRAKKKK